MVTQTYVIPGIPRPQGSKKHVGKGRLIESSPHTKTHRNHTAWILKTYKPILIPKPTPINITCTYQFLKPKTSKLEHPTKPPDLDKLLRLTFDAITGILIQDDSQITHITASKEWVTENPQTIITINFQ